MKALRCASILLAAVFLPVSPAWALGHGLGETKEQLKLDYEVVATDHRTGRVTVNLTISDQGRLKPLRSVDLVIPGADKTGYVDLSVSLATTKVDGKLHARVHLLRELAERAEIQLRTGTLDGRQQPMTWYYYSIPIADYLKDEAPKQPVPGTTVETPAPAPPPAATQRNLE